eukprot:CAMPEP_0182464702 /NCGR_PEP_ID=MMETSP1319-20130603/8789_1 /TAXON_ID=172717 /ORGANISM="Bolidomonas pacifica, Strain RCC208" /LENGTH=114 /DNA_ID=CAMNT_0024664361 /DNA_START=167 /DNA_END=508 /DNA_ORIENTATION=-
MGQSKSKYSSAQLNTFCKPTGMYASTPLWTPKKLRRAIGGGMLAPRSRPAPDTMLVGGKSKECPICFENYTVYNITSCCSKCVCTECYLQVQDEEGTKECPFCKRQSMKVVPAE